MGVVVTLGSQIFWPYGGHSVLTLTWCGALEPKNPVYTCAVGVCRKLILPPPAGLDVQLSESSTCQAAYTDRTCGRRIQCTLGAVLGRMSGVKGIRRAVAFVTEESTQMSSCLELVRRR